MKYKGLNKTYFGIGLEDDFLTFTHKVFYFYWFKLLQKNPEEETLKRGRDYKGFIINFRLKIPSFGIKI